MPRITNHVDFVNGTCVCAIKFEKRCGSVCLEVIKSFIKFSIFNFILLKSRWKFSTEMFSKPMCLQSLAAEEVSSAKLYLRDLKLYSWAVILLQ